MPQGHAILPQMPGRSQSFSQIGEGRNSGQWCNEDFIGRKKAVFFDVGNDTHVWPAHEHGARLR